MGKFKIFFQRTQRYINKAVTTSSKSNYAVAVKHVQELKNVNIKE